MRKTLEFEVRDHVFLRVIPLMGVGRALKPRKLTPRFICPYEILKRVGEVAYQIAFPMLLANLPDGAFMYWLTAIYGLNKLEQRKVLWKDLDSLNIQGPWILAGDFNNVLCSQDRIGGKDVHESGFKDLEEMMKNNNLTEMPSNGDYYTWSNKHHIGTIYSRIDKILGNTDWFQDHMDYSLQILPPNVSDHSLLFLQHQDTPQTRHKRFKFLNCLTDTELYSQIVHTNWNEPIEETSKGIIQAE
ncbi:uncharacterized protein LOC131597524 [Vicia villosa]|uniref:uncharacterized protein LOC131597524 n=1 Tax=Vicia villosa TaxID=3911 RepID=UPI00273B280D|nr:uncharacterized protein LOC131597524 [Vicia villosa]